MELFQKMYDGESIFDLERDVSESLSSVYNPLAAEIPRNEYGIQEGKFKVSITWEPDDA